MEAAGVGMSELTDQLIALSSKKGGMSQREFKLMSEQERKSYMERRAIYKETHIRLMKIYAKYNPEIKALKAMKMQEYWALYEWREQALAPWEVEE